ncbi:biotin transporter BioY [Brotaphodocola sp.]|uniref:biotin transporter BioY n=1 Tax=Brotaphodocola sp. TaxID=3073577 RepID=UPI003D7D1B18
MNLAVCGLFAALIAAGAFIKITIPMPLTDMHFTMQWFFVLLAGLLLSSNQAFASVGTYLIVGLIGIPVFATGGGPAYLLKPTFGFLLGFALAAWTMGFLSERMHATRALPMMIPATAGFVVYYGMGLIYFYLIANFLLANPIGWKEIFVVYCVGTMAPDYILCVLAAVVAARLKPVISQMMIYS